jgi:two-component system, chemotaxis family, protein-glutamate methylesterase/glutaminase
MLGKDRDIHIEAAGTKKMPTASTKAAATGRRSTVTDSKVKVIEKKVRTANQETIAADCIEAIVIGTSAGGVQALLRILSPLPRQLRMPIVIVLHMPEKRDSLLEKVFQEHMAPPVRMARDKEPIDPGTVYFAGPGYHLSIERDRHFSLSSEEPANYSRPAIDFLMTSAADAYGAALLGILLTGSNEDGARGLASVHDAGGITVVEDPATAEFATMPQAARELREPDYILSLDQIQSLIHRLETHDAG